MKCSPFGVSLQRHGQQQALGRKLASFFFLIFFFKNKIMIISAGGRADSSQSDGQAGFNHEKHLLAGLGRRYF